MFSAGRFPDGYVNKKLEFWGDLARRVKTRLTESKDDRVATFLNRSRKLF